MADYWQLPDGIDEVLPPRARELELTRRVALDVFERWGYEYIEPPIIERLAALTVGSDSSVERQAFKLVDPVGGDLLAVRAEMTAQAARIDAHSRASTEGPQRLCYAGPVARAHRSTPLSSRMPYLVGAELFGADGVNADAEVAGLLIEVLDRCEVASPLLVLGHVGIFRSLADRLNLDETRRRQVYDALQSKSETDIAALLESDQSSAMISLAGMMGDETVLARANSELGREVAPAIAELGALSEALKAKKPDIRLFFDLGEVAGYDYHTGALFSAYGEERGQPLARGGRYDGAGEKFGRRRSATGFDVDLKQLPPRSSVESKRQGAVYAPMGFDASLQSAIDEMRAAGERVVQALSDDEVIPAYCDRVLELHKGEWTAKSLR